MLVWHHHDRAYTASTPNRAGAEAFASLSSESHARISLRPATNNASFRRAHSSSCWLILQWQWIAVLHCCICELVTTCICKSVTSNLCALVYTTWMHADCQALKRTARTGLLTVVDYWWLYKCCFTFRFTNFHTYADHSSFTFLMQPGKDQGCSAVST